MGTKFKDIYDRAIFMFKDYNLIQLSTDASREAVLEQYLMSAVFDFADLCEFDLTAYDVMSKTFNETLDYKTIEILARGLVYHWLCAQEMSTEMLRNSLSTKDFTQYSPANLLNALTTLREDLYEKYNKEIILYSYRNGDIAGINL